MVQYCSSCGCVPCWTVEYRPAMLHSLATKYMRLRSSYESDSSGPRLS